MPRFKLIIEYDGTDFVGWQRQDNGASIQGALEEAVFKLCGEQVTVHGAGRTDAGVHAFGQAAHFDLEKMFTADKVRDALNHHLKPARIAVLDAEEASPDFHARFSAKARHYHYRIVCRHSPLALDEGRAWHIVRDLDADMMDIAAQALAGHHDFTTFRSSECQAKSPVKTLDKFTVRRAGDEIHFDVSARSFLHNQVRSMVGSLKLVGEGKWLASDIARALESKTRASCGPVAPPDGLYLVRVDY